jgi:hypothetical protein
LPFLSGTGGRLHVSNGSGIGCGFGDGLGAGYGTVEGVSGFGGVVGFGGASGVGVAGDGIGLFLFLLYISSRKFHLP